MTALPYPGVPEDEIGETGIAVEQWANTQALVRDVHGDLGLDMSPDGICIVAALLVLAVRTDSISFLLKTPENGGD